MAGVFSQSIWMEEPIVLFSEVSNIGTAHDLTVTENGDIVAVRDANIIVYNSEGRLFKRIEYSTLKDAWNVVAKGDTLYVSDRTAGILMMDFDGNVKKTVTLPKSVKSQGDNGLTVDNNGNIYISCHCKHSIYKCKPNETKAKVFIQKGTHPDLEKPHFLCVTPGGELVVSNHGSSAIQVYDKNGEFLWQYKGHGDMTLSYPWGVCCDSKGYIYIADCGNDRIQVVQNGEFQKCIQQQTRGIPLDKEDNIICSYDNKISKVKIWQ